jgi:hypothetical protein
MSFLHTVFVFDALQSPHALDVVVVREYNACGDVPCNIEVMVSTARYNYRRCWMLWGVRTLHSHCTAQLRPSSTHQWAVQHVVLRALVATTLVTRQHNRR